MEDYYVENDTSEEYDEEVEMGSEEVANLTYNDKPESVSKKTVARVLKEINEDGSLKKIIRARKSDFVRNLIYLDGSKFDFTGRDYLRPIYDRNDQQILLKNARQTEKCQTLQEIVTLSSGKRVESASLKVGDTVVSFKGYLPETDTVVAVESNGKKRVLKITTKKKRSVTVTHNHPFRTLLGWTEASQLKVGDFVGLPHTAGAFGNIHDPVRGRILGHLLAEGGLYKNYISFTQTPGSNLDDFLSSCEKLGSSVHAKSFPCRPSVSRVNIYQKDVLFNFFKPYLEGRRSATLDIPDWVYNADQDTTIGFLNALWAGDGHCKDQTGERNTIDLCYSSTSWPLIEGVQALLLKLGIMSSIRENIPTIYRGTDKKAYILRVIDERSFTRFKNILGDVLGKPFSLEGHGGKDQSDVIPKEVASLIRQITRVEGKCREYGAKNLTRYGLRAKPEYNLQRNKFLRYCEILQDSRLWDIYNGEVYWDPIVSIEDLGEEDTLAVEVKNNHNFVTGGIITHNTTFLANNLTVSAVVQPYNKALYVSPSHTQTRQFSNEKLRPAIEKSPLIAKYYQDSKVSSQVFEKGFTNGSYIFLRSAFRSADRTRGISARSLYLDEIQDFLGSEIPVIMECTSHFLDARTFMSGTPKSFDNPIEDYWASTTQNEWIVKCTHCGKNNFLDETNIAPTAFYTSGRLPPGPVCSGCQKPISPSVNGRWVSFRKDAPIQGYRVPQLMVPWICGLYDQWIKLLWKRDNYPFGQFYNEVLGLSYDSASKPITRDEVISCCSDYSLWNPAMLQNAVAANRYQLTAGIDWGEGNDGSEKSPLGKVRSASYTVLTIGGYMNQKVWKTLMIKRYMGKEIEPDYIVKDIARIVKGLGIKLVGVDWGHGWGVNNHLIRLLGPEMVVQYQHLPKLKQKMKWDHTGKRYHLHRNFMMSELFFDIKQKFVQFPKWSEFEPYAKDILGIFSEYSEYKREIKYDHKPSDPDDFFHSLLYSKLTSDLFLGKSRRYTADIPGGVGSIDLNNYTR